MKKHHTAAVSLLIATALILTACDKGAAPPSAQDQADAISTEQAAPADASSQTPAPPAAPSATSASSVQVLIGDSTFQIAIDAPSCEKLKEGGLIANVKWNIPETEMVDIYVQAPDGERKLWVTGSTSGEDKTGPWVTLGTKISIQRHDNSAPLFEKVVESTGCP